MGELCKSVSGAVSVEAVDPDWGSNVAVCL